MIIRSWRISLELLKQEIYYGVVYYSFEELKSEIKTIYKNIIMSKELKRN